MEPDPTSSHRHGMGGNGESAAPAAPLPDGGGASGGAVSKEGGTERVGPVPSSSQASVGAQVGTHGHEYPVQDHQYRLEEEIGQGASATVRAPTPERKTNPPPRRETNERTNERYERYEGTEREVLTGNVGKPRAKTNRNIKKQKTKNGTVETGVSCAMHPVRRGRGGEAGGPGERDRQPGEGNRRPVARIEKQRRRMKGGKRNETLTQTTRSRTRYRGKPRP